LNRYDNAIERTNGKAKAKTSKNPKSFKPFLSLAG
jgi:hypothetical protein